MELSKDEIIMIRFALDDRIKEYQKLVDKAEFKFAKINLDIYVIELEYLKKKLGSELRKLNGE